MSFVFDSAILKFLNLWPSAFSLKTALHYIILTTFDYFWTWLSSVDTASKASVVDPEWFILDETSNRSGSRSFPYQTLFKEQKNGKFL